MENMLTQEAYESKDRITEVVANEMARLNGRIVKLANTVNAYRSYLSILSEKLGIDLSIPVDLEEEA